MNIGQLSKKVGVSSKAIRFYEEIGLIGKTRRNENGYRDYSQANVDELKIIKYARDLGLPIKEIKNLMVGCKDGDCRHSKEYLIEEIQNYLGILKQKETQMAALKEKLKVLKKSIEKGTNNKNTKYCCNILGQLTEITKGGGKNAMLRR